MKTHQRKKLVRTSFTLLACLVMAACTQKAPTESAASPEPPAPEVAAEPAFALVTVPLGKSAPTDYASQIAQWKSAGQASNVVLLEKLPKQLAETGKKSAAYESMAIVEFPDESAYAEWNVQAAPRLGPDAVVKRADLLIHDEINPRDAATAYYAVNHYEALVPAGDYKTYSQTYIMPNMANQKDSGVMTSYSMYLEREPAGTNSKAVLVKEYLNEDAFIRSDAIKEEHKERVLLKDAEWSRINDTKTAIRTDLNETLSKQVVLP